MGGVLGEHGWCSSALRLLEHTRALPVGRPLLIHVRHTERDSMRHPRDNPVSTVLGKEAAREFGAALPTASYRVWHTSVDRTRETALSIKAGLEDSGSTCECMGWVGVSTIFDLDRFHGLPGTYEVVEDTAESASAYLTNWVAGLYPPDVVRPSLEFAQMIAHAMVTGAGDCSGILVSHDTWVAALMLHWLGMQPPRDWVGFLDGFAMALGNPYAIVATKQGTKRLRLPHWWENKTRPE
ncbi:hypothetical protein JXL21_03550 [Candidatus Bathyarchaeota archaeon]|nr:hypothetical protein [Candidatus Bathyarchaeota archaeon]